MNREEETPGRKEHISGKEMTALASSGYRGTVESSTGTAEKPAAADTGPADRLATAQDTLTEDLGNYLDTKISEKRKAGAFPGAGKAWKADYPAGV